jgi:hypothetical protein
MAQRAGAIIRPTYDIRKKINLTSPADRSENQLIERLGDLAMERMGDRMAKSMEHRGAVEEPSHQPARGSIPE